MKLIPLRGKHGKGKFTMIDDDLYAELSKHKWRLNYKGYVVRTIGEQGHRKPLYLHHLVIDCPPNMVRDHVNRNKIDNQLHNIRIVTQGDNTRNRERTKHYHYGEPIYSIYSGVV